MNTQKGFVIPLIIALVVIAAAAGVYYETQQKRRIDQPQTTSNASDTEVTNKTSSHDNQGVEATIVAFLRASRAATSDAQVNLVIDTYYTPEAAQHAKVTASQIVPDAGKQSIFVQESQDMPDPSDLKDSSTTIIDGFAVSTFIFNMTPSVRVNGKTLTTDQKTYVVFSLQKIGNRWLINHISFQVE